MFYILITDMIVDVMLYITCNTMSLGNCVTVDNDGSFIRAVDSISIPRVIIPT